MSDYSQLEEQRQLPIWILNSEAIKSFLCSSSPLFQRRLWHAGHDFLYFNGNAPAHPSFLDHWGCSWLLGESMLLSFNIFAVPLTVACRFGPKCWINFDCWARSWCQVVNPQNHSDLRFGDLKIFIFRIFYFRSEFRHISALRILDGWHWMLSDWLKDAGDISIATSWLRVLSSTARIHI